MTGPEVPTTDLGDGVFASFDDGVISIGMEGRGLIRLLPGTLAALFAYQTTVARAVRDWAENFDELDDVDGDDPDDEPPPVAA